MAHRFHTASKNTPAAKARAAQYASREYRQQHEADRRLVLSGQAHCWRCHRHIPPTARCGPDWQSGHDDHDRTILRGPECTRCNRTAAARAGARAQRRRTYKQSRQWITP